MTLPEARCCGDHPGDWDRPAVPGTGWCAECLARLRDEQALDRDDTHEGEVT